MAKHGDALAGERRKFVEVEDEVIDTVGFAVSFWRPCNSGSSTKVLATAGQWALTRRLSRKPCCITTARERCCAPIWHIEPNAIADDPTHFLLRHHPVVMRCGQQCLLVSVQPNMRQGHDFTLLNCGTFFDEGTHAFTKIVFCKALRHPTWSHAWLQPEACSGGGKPALSSPAMTLGQHWQQAPHVVLGRRQCFTGFNQTFGETNFFASSPLNFRASTAVRALPDPMSRAASS